MGAKNREISEKEKKFCFYYANTQSAREAAARAGYGVLAELSGLRLLAREEIREYIASLEKAKPREHLVRAGLERIAFGGISDAVKLILNDDVSSDSKALEEMDLYCISEIKRQKGGGMEIKFFDRLKALEKLMSISEEGTDGISPFYRAVTEGAKNLYSGEVERNFGV